MRIGPYDASEGMGPIKSDIKGIYVYTKRGLGACKTDQDLPAAGNKGKSLILPGKYPASGHMPFLFNRIEPGCGCLAMVVIEQGHRGS